MVALSVSISARISPSSTVSPTFFNQEATVPSSIVSLKRGIVIISTPSGTSAELALASGSAGAVASSTLGASSETAALPPFSKAEISSPSSPIIANKVSTGAPSPSAIPIWSKVPSLKDSNSIVALSVSISAKISPSSTLSPTFLSHFATVPSSMVSLNLGIFITSAI